MLQTSTVNAQTKIKICHEASHYPPFIYQDNADKKGILLDIIEQTAAKTGVQIEIYSKPWARCQQDVKAGKAQALFAMISTKERQAEFAFPPTDFEKSWHLWYAQYPIFLSVGSSFNADNYKPEKGIGAPLGYVVWQKLKQKNWLSPYQYQPIDGLKMLARNKLDGYVVEKLIGLHLINENQLNEQVKVSNHTILTSYWYLPFNKTFYKKEKNLIHRFWQVMASVREQIKNIPIESNLNN